MKNTKLEEILSDSNFVNKLLNLDTGDDVKNELLKKGVTLKEEDLGQFSGILADALEKRQLSHVVGGTQTQCLKMETKDANVGFKGKVQNWMKKVFGK